MAQPSLAAPPSCDPAEAKLALERVLGSQVFSKAPHSRRRLRHAVARALGEASGDLKQSPMAGDGLPRGEDNEPGMDAGEQAEAGHLRRCLCEYYDKEGAADPWILELLEDGSSVSFVRRLGPNDPSQGASAAHPDAADERLEPGFEDLAKAYTRWFWASMAVGLVVLAVAAATLLAVISQR